ncbi:8386_t:CDS:2 [Diversispora eburnea]|uniref:8386_t:CDS:1 n=1 Tax=Diversispora eburnea TaxID=1213867 RepID=A0A9N9CIE8_9GLOM|nr:8386_t:CDS:2 [Diversispora eburnea]
MINFYTSIRVGVGVIRGSFRSLDNKIISKFNNFQRIQGYHKYHKTLFSPQTFKIKIFKISNTSKIFTTINTISRHNLRNFHSTRPTYAPLPAFLILFKSANAALLIRTFSNLLLSFLPLALIKNPKTGQPRRLLLFLTTVIPLTGFGILLLLGLEQAPHTNRWRFRFMSLEEEKEICNAAYLAEREKYQDKILSNDRIETILNNKIVESLEDSDDDETNKPDNFEIFVVEDDSVLNAVSFGVSKKIIVFTGWLKVIDYNEEYLSVTLAHEIGHVLQRHASEALGFNQVMYIITVLSSLGPLINDYLNKATQDLIGSYSSGRYNQKVEKEADIIGLKLMALSENINKFFASHPIEAVRAKYLDALLPEAEKIYENVIANGGKANSINLNDYIDNDPIETVINVEELLISKIWNGIIYFLGLKNN